MKLYEECSLQYRFKYVDKEPALKSATSYAMIVGSIVHDVLELAGGRRLINRHHPDHATDPFPEVCGGDELLQILNLDLSTDYVKRDDYEKAKAEAGEVLVECAPLDFTFATGIEKIWGLDVFGIKVAGIMDVIRQKIVTLPDGEKEMHVIIHDYKTGRPFLEEPELDVQILTYMAAAKSIYDPDGTDNGVVRVFAQLDYIRTGQVIGPFEWDKYLQRYLFRKVKSTWKKISEDKEFPANPGSACARCTYRRCCDPFKAYLKAGNPEPKEGDDVEVLVAERMRLSGLQKAADEARRDIDKKLQSLLGSRKSIKVNGNTVRKAGRRQPTVRTDVVLELAKHLDESPKKVLEKIGSISSPKAKKYVAGDAVAEKLLSERTSLDQVTWIEVRKGKDPLS